MGRRPAEGGGGAGSGAQAYFVDADVDAGAFSDKNTVERDAFVEAVRGEALYTEHCWECHTETGDARTCKGAWILCDQGYLPWGTLICAFTSAMSGTAMGAWNSLLGSVRKDSECTFGAMKKRFRILRLPFLFRPTHKIGRVFRVCAALHNMLLDHDGMDDIGQEEWHWIERDTTETVTALQQSGHTGAAAQLCDYTYLGVAFSPHGRPTVDDQQRHHALKNVLLQHYVHMKTTKQLRWLKTARTILAKRDLNA